jgi:hypothetical protein
LQTGRLLSLQLGLSHERTFAQAQNGVTLANSGGSGVFAHQGLMVGVNEHVQVFALLSLAIRQQWCAPKTVSDSASAPARFWSSTDPVRLRMSRRLPLYLIGTPRQPRTVASNAFERTFRTCNVPDTFSQPFLP